MRIITRRCTEACASTTFGKLHGYAHWRSKNSATARKSASDRSAPGADGMVADMRYLYANAAAAKWKKAAEGKSLRNRRCLRLVSLVRFFARRKEMNEKISRPARVVRGRVSEKKSH